MTLDQAERRMKEIVKMDFLNMTPTDKVMVVSEAHAINAKFKAVDHDCNLTALLDALTALRADLEV